MSKNSKSKKILIIVENLTMPIDRRVWQEAITLRDNGYDISIICPVGGEYTRKYEVLDGIHVYRHPLPYEAEGALGYIVEYSTALFWEFLLTIKIAFTRGFDVIQACNPPDTIFLIGGLFRLFGKKFVFDHHDINPELFEAKFGKKGALHKILIFLERLTFKTANISIATNGNFKDIAIKRGNMKDEDVYIVRSTPDLSKFKRTTPLAQLKNGRKYVLGYVGIMGAQDGVDLLIKAMSEIAHKHKREDIQCVLVGSGTEVPLLKKLTATEDVTDYINFTGYLSGQELLSTYSTFDIGVIPDPKNPYNDKISMNKVFEYMALGIPFVQFDLSEGKKAAKDAAIYAKDNDYKDLAQKILMLIDNPKKCKEMSKFAQERATTDFTWEKEKIQLLAAYDKIFQEK